jgi:hypothetical protein
VRSDFAGDGPPINGMFLEMAATNAPPERPMPIEKSQPKKAGFIFRNEFPMKRPVTKPVRIKKASRLNKIFTLFRKGHY